MKWSLAAVVLTGLIGCDRAQVSHDGDAPGVDPVLDPLLAWGAVELVPIPAAGLRVALRGVAFTGSIETPSIVVAGGDTLELLPVMLDSAAGLASLRIDAVAGARATELWRGPLAQGVAAPRGERSPYPRDTLGEPLELPLRFYSRRRPGEQVWYRLGRRAPSAEVRARSEGVPLSRRNPIDFTFAGRSCVRLVARLEIRTFGLDVVTTSLAELVARAGRAEAVSAATTARALVPGTGDVWLDLPCPDASDRPWRLTLKSEQTVHESYLLGGELFFATEGGGVSPPPAPLAQLLHETIRVDLSALAGDRVRLRMTVDAPGAGGRAAILLARIERRAPARPPDLLMICSDSHRFDRAIIDRGPGLMPALTALRAEPTAITYTNAFSPASWTLPSIVSTFAGVAARFHRAGERGEILERARFERDGSSVPVGWFEAPIDRERLRLMRAYPAAMVSLTERLRGAGYRTVMVAGNPLYGLSGLGRDGQDVFIDGAVQAGDILNDVALQVVAGTPAERPLFLLVHYMDVHHYVPWCLEKRHPELEIVPEKRAEFVACYEQAVAATDGHLGQLIDAWRAARRHDSTIVFWSDHGDHLMDPGRETLIDHGNSMDEVLLRVPMVVRYPRVAGTGGGDDPRPASLLDLMPTLLELAGQVVPTGAGRGRSLVRAPLAAERILHADYQLYDAQLASVRAGARKLVLDLDNDGASLIDLGAPPGAYGEPAQAIDDATEVARLRALYAAYVDEARVATATLTSDEVIDQQAAVEQLRSLGYVD